MGIRVYRFSREHPSRHLPAVSDYDACRAANVALLESVAAAVAIAETTGDGSALAKLISSLPEEQRKVIA